MLVDPDNLTRQTLRGQLLDLGHEVVAVEGAEAAFAFFEMVDRPPDILITEVSIPAAGGRALAEEVRRRWPETKIIFVSDRVEEHLVADGQLPPGSLLLQKPVDQSAVARAIATVLEGLAAPRDGGV